MADRRIKDLGDGNYDADAYVATDKENQGTKRVKLGSLVEQVKQQVIDIMYPVGSVYLQVGGNPPVTTFGGTWEQIAQGRCLWGSDSNHSAGTEISAGLPDISAVNGAVSLAQLSHTHSINAVCSATTANNRIMTGKSTADSGFYYSSATATGSTTFSGSLTTNVSLNKSSVYGGSETVQPPAYVVTAWKRTA